MNEADFKRMIVNDFLSQKHYAKRIEHQYAVGVPDLLVKHCKVPAALIEVKYFRNETRSDTFPNKATPKQREQLIAFKNAGGIAFTWSIFKSSAPGAYIIRSTDNFTSNSIIKDDCFCFIKERQKNWNFPQFFLDHCEKLYYNIDV